MTNWISRTELAARLAAGEAIVLVEALGAAFFADGHLPGAINLPISKVESLAPQLIPETDATVVVYCSGFDDCAETVSDSLGRLGYTDVRVYEGGKNDWIEHGLPTERLADPD